jgi:hypothetical protein
MIGNGEQIALAASRALALQNALGLRNVAGVVFQGLMLLLAHTNKAG